MLSNTATKQMPNLFLNKDVNLKFFHIINSILWIHGNQTQQEKTVKPEHDERPAQR